MPSKVIINIVGQDDVSAKLKEIRSQFDTTSSSPGWKSIMQGAAMGVGMAAWNALGGAVSGAESFLKDTVQSAMDNEASIAKLKTSLMDNVPAWDGNTEAIGKVLEARTKLGFSDTEQQDALAILVARTGDAAEALKIEAVAMDLARLKGIDLDAATKAISMGMMGSGKALKELGINVADYTDKTEVLGAVEAKAAGQADAFGNTTAGAMKEMQVSMEEVSRELGTALLPMLKTLADWIKDHAVPAVEDLGLGMDYMAWRSAEADKQNTFFLGSLSLIPAVADAAHIGINDYAKAMVAAKEAQEAATQATFAGVAAAGILTASVSAAAGVEVVQARNAGLSAASLATLGIAFEDVAKKARANQLDAAWNLKELPFKIAVAKDDIVKAQKDLEDARTKVERDAAALSLVDAKHSLVLLQQAYVDAKAGAKEAGQKLGDSYAGGLLSGIHTGMDRVVGVLSGLTATPWQAPTPTSTPTLPHKAGGGPVTGGYPYLVGERGPELFVPGNNGSIVPNGGNSLTLAPGAIVINGAGSPAATADATLLALKRETQRQGMTFS
jgi:hypothetical protein